MHFLTSMPTLCDVTVSVGPKLCCVLHWGKLIIDLAWLSLAWINSVWLSLAWHRLADDMCFLPQYLNCVMSLFWLETLWSLSVRSKSISACLSVEWLSLAWLCLPLFCSAWLNSTSSGSAPLNLAWLSSTQLGSNFGMAQINFHSSWLGSFWLN